MIKNNISHLNPNNIPNINNSTINKDPNSNNSSGNQNNPNNNSFSNNKKNLHKFSLSENDDSQLIPKLKTCLTDNSQFFNSPKNKNLIENKNLEDVECYINPDPKRSSLTHNNNNNTYTDFNTNQKLKKRNSAKKSNPSNRKSEQENLNVNQYNSNFSLSQNSAVQQEDENYINFGTLSNKNFAIYDIGDLNNFEEKNSDMVNFFPKKTFAFIYFEILNFSFSQKDYFKGIYPEMNLVMIMEINDCVLSQEKIFFTKFDEKTYIPILKKEDLQYQDDKKINRYRVMKSLEINDENYPIKITFNFYSFTNMRLLSLGSEDFFFTLNNDNKLNKFHLYQNIYLKYVSKKIGNLGFNYSYKTEEIYAKDLLIEMKNSLKTFIVRLFFI